MEERYICEMKGVTKWFPPDTLVVNRMNLNIRKNERILICGLAGSGKTSLIRLLAGELKPDEGEISMNGTIAVVPARPGLVSGMNLQQHIALPLLCRGYRRKEAMTEAGNILERLGEISKSSLRPYQMHAYERAVVAVGQAVIQKADLLAADTFMDELNEQERQKVLKMLFSAADKALLMMSDRALPDWPFDRYLELDQWKG